MVWFILGWYALSFGLLISSLRGAEEVPIDELERGV